MRRYLCVFGALVIALGTFGTISAETEDEIVARYLKKMETKHTKKISWVAVNYTMNRINRNNDYNSWATYESNFFSDTDIPWLGQASTFGIDFGVGFNKKFAWTIGGEYWLKFGTSQTGTYSYDPPLGTATIIEEITSEIQVYGVTTGFQYYLMNPPTPKEQLTNIAVRLHLSGGYYHAAWELFDEFENYNLATASPTSTNTTYESSAPGFTGGFGFDYPLNFYGFALGADFSYMYLNFTDVAWYNAQDQEIIVTYNGTPDGRVDLDLSGFRGKVELKRFFTF